mmetsp:Transcript_24348/g.59044  ORF Transcript_24348/g.59044 Transcript_24348/m.59044 type:complete len:439 (-) Transcript_24348:37-1353(-)
MAGADSWDTHFASKVHDLVRRVVYLDRRIETLTSPRRFEIYAAQASMTDREVDLMREADFEIMKKCDDYRLEQREGLSAKMKYDRSLLRPDIKESAPNSRQGADSSVVHLLSPSVRGRLWAFRNGLVRRRIALDIAEKRQGEWSQRAMMRSLHEERNRQRSMQMLQARQAKLDPLDDHGVVYAGMRKLEPLSSQPQSSARTPRSRARLERPRVGRHSLQPVTHKRRQTTGKKAAVIPFTEHDIRFLYDVFRTDVVGTSTGPVTWSSVVDGVKSSKDNGQLLSSVVRAMESRGITESAPVTFADFVSHVWPHATRADKVQVTKWVAGWQVEECRNEAAPLLPPLPEHTLLEIAETFGALDSDRSGRIDVEEMFQGMTLASSLPNQSETEQMLRLFDKDKDGELDFVEFVQMLMPFGFDPPGKSVLRQRLEPAWHWLIPP